MTTTTIDAQKIAPFKLPIDNRVSIRYGEYGKDDCFAYISEEGAIVRFQMDFLGDITGAFFLCEFETASMQRDHLKALFSKALPCMSPVWATENILWEDDF